MARQKVFRTGNSLAVTIPAEFAQGCGIRAGDEVRVREDKTRSRLTYQFSGIQQLSLVEKVAQPRSAGRKTK